MGAAEKLSAPPANRVWAFAVVGEPVQCCWCGVLMLPGDNAMVMREPEGTWWSHYDIYPCYGTKDQP